MGDIPHSALWLGLAGLIPFLYAALATLTPAAALPFAPPARVFDTYGLIIFAYMAGVFWGFSAWGPKEWRGYVLAVAPAVIVFLALIAAPGATHVILTVAFPGLLLFDRAFHLSNLAPGW